jgi:hypothetical protein
VDEELAFHLAMRVEEFLRAGMSEDEAKEAVMKRFGDMHDIRMEVETIARNRHARRRRAWKLDAFRRVLRFALRTLISNPGFSVVVALTLALGIGANAAVFSVAYGVLLRPLPYRDADQLVRLWSKNAKRNVEFFPFLRPTTRIGGRSRGPSQPWLRSSDSATQRSRRATSLAPCRSRLSPPTSFRFSVRRRRLAEP